MTVDIHEFTFYSLLLKSHQEIGAMLEVGPSLFASSFGVSNLPDYW